MVVGPEQPLVEGVVDFFQEDRQLQDIPVIGPKRDAALLEGSKAFAKVFMEKHGIPTAGYHAFDTSSMQEGLDYLAARKGRVVLKADGLAAGKGAIVCKDREEALVALDKVMKTREFGVAGDKVVIEECMVGDEVSVIALSDGENFVTLVPSQDHKRIFDNDQGPNTGGMGAYAPTPHIPVELMKQIEDEIIAPTIKGMCRYL